MLCPKCKQHGHNNKLHGIILKNITENYKVEHCQCIRGHRYKVASKRKGNKWYYDSVEDL